MTKRKIVLNDYCGGDNVPPSKYQPLLWAVLFFIALLLVAYADGVNRSVGLN